MLGWGKNLVADGMAEVGRVSSLNGRVARYEIDCARLSLTHRLEAYATPCGGAIWTGWKRMLPCAVARFGRAGSVCCVARIGGVSHRLEAYATRRGGAAGWGALNYARWGTPEST
ncbi:hypothetical protein B7486_11295 [cyanobacterium TDX16]|nr:hypothetical protein B7486_11295 [cyanobacterium TDX16]